MCPWGDMAHSGEASRFRNVYVPVMSVEKSADLIHRGHMFYAPCKQGVNVGFKDNRWITFHESQGFIWT